MIEEIEFIEVMGMIEKKVFYTLLYIREIKFIR